MKRILFIENGLSNPFKVSNGGSQRTNLLLQACAHVADVDVITFFDERCAADNTTYSLLHAGQLSSKKESRFDKLIRLLHVGSPRSFATLDKDKERLIDSYVRQKNYDYIVVRYVNQAVECGLLKYGNRLIVDVDDSPYDAALRDSKLARTKRNRMYHVLFARFAKRGLCSLVKNTNTCFFSNYEQAMEFNGVFLPNVPFYSVKNENISDTLTIKGRLLFVGDFCYAPNIQGANHFMTNIFPRIKEQYPSVSIHLVGKGHAENKKIWESQGADVMGFVDDILKEYAETDCVVIPIYEGAGTCIKILEAMQMRRPIVTTPTGMRGYSQFIEKGEDILVASDDNEFANHIVALLNNCNLRLRLRECAASKCQQIFTKEHFMEIVKQNIDCSC